MSNSDHQATIDRVLECVDEQAAVELAQELVRIDSTNPPGNEEKVAKSIKKFATERGLEAEIQPVSPGRANVVVRLPETTQQPASRNKECASLGKLLYCGHLDTVRVGEASWEFDPFGGEIIDGELWGVGAVDMKSGVAAILAGMAAHHKAKTNLPFELSFAGVIGEEVDCAGSRHFLKAGGMEGVGALVIAEPTNLDIVHAHKGALRVEVKAKGAAAHSSTPDKGIDTIVPMAHFVARLDTELEDRLGQTAEHPLLGRSTRCISQNAGGTAINIVADTAWARVDIRTIPGQSVKALLDCFHTVAACVKAQFPEVELGIKVLAERAPVDTDPTHALIAATQQATQYAGKKPSLRGVAFFSDASVLQPETGVPTVLIGPGKTELMHATDERVSVSAIGAAAKTFTILPLTAAKNKATAMATQ